MRIKASETWLVKGLLTQKGKAFKSLIGKQIQYVAVFECGCGNRLVVTHGSVAGGHTRSCGCVRKGLSNEKAKTHGHTKTLSGKTTVSREYRTWCNMRARCDNPNNMAYEDYGGRGISYDPRWVRFESFIEDMGDRPEGTSLDRIDNNKSYSKDNCRWATPKQQANNKRSNVVISINGISKTMSEWSLVEGAAKTGTIHYRIKRGWSHQNAVFGKQTKECPSNA